MHQQNELPCEFCGFRVTAVRQQAGDIGRDALLVLGRDPVGRAAGVGGLGSSVQRPLRPVPPPGLARAICHGGRGQIRQAHRGGQGDQLAGLGLVLNAVVLWNSRCLNAAVAHWSLGILGRRLAAWWRGRRPRRSWRPPVSRRRGGTPLHRVGRRADWRVRRC
ncbi:Tn3 family transposase [Streptomyces sp. ISL-10]|nr:Tn3 family transposase [Streptomyces sp. ISL-10]